MWGYLFICSSIFDTCQGLVDTKIFPATTACSFAVHFVLMFSLKMIFAAKLYGWIENRCQCVCICLAYRDLIWEHCNQTLSIDDLSKQVIFLVNTIFLKSVRVPIKRLKRDRSERRSQGWEKEEDSRLYSYLVDSFELKLMVIIFCFISDLCMHKFDKLLIFANTKTTVYFFLFKFISIENFQFKFVSVFKRNMWMWNYMHCVRAIRSLTNNFCHTE